MEAIADVGRTAKQKEREVFKEQMALFQYFDSYRSLYEDKAVDGYKKFIGYKEETEADREAEENGEAKRSNIHIPRTYQIVDTIRARMVMVFFKNYPYFEFIPQPTQMERFSLQNSEKKAEVASALVNEQLKKNNIVAKYHDYITSTLIFPKGYMGVGWRYEEAYLKKKVPVPEIIQTPYGPQYTGNSVYQVRESLETIWDDNEISNIDFFDFWPDPKGYDLDSCRGVFHREFLTFEELVERLKFLSFLNEGELYVSSPEELWEIQGEPVERGREKRMAEVGKSDNGLDIFMNSKDENIKKNAEFEILTYWQDDRRIMTVNRKKTVYNGPSPYWRHRKKPFVAASYERLPNEFYGMSAVDIISDLQEEENAIHNQRSDNINFILNKMWKVRRGADIDPSELISRPGGIVYVNNMEDVDEFDMSDVAASSFTQHNIISSIMENTLATPPVIRGAESTKSKTATETIKQTGNAGMRFDIKIALFEDLDIKRLLYLMDMNNQQFIDSSRLVRLGVNEAMSWRTVNPGELIGEFDYRPASANIDPAANKEIRREQLTMMMQFLMQSGFPGVDMHELMKEWLQSFNIENAEKFILPKDQWQRMQMMMMYQAQQQAGDGSSTASQSQNAATGRSRGRRPQTERNPSEQGYGSVK